MRPIRTFVVTPRLPEALESLREVAYNLRWAWDHEAIELFRRLDGDLWEASGHNPARMLGAVSQKRLEAAAADDAFLAHLERVAADFRQGECRACWFERAYPSRKGMLAAYFSAEFGVTECLSIFAGGLGILAGDHLKSAADLGVPLVGVGLLYQQGYFRQYLNQAGWQQESYEDNDFLNLPIQPARRADGSAVIVEVGYPGRTIRAQVWLARVGRVPLYLLDTNIAWNRGADRDLTDQLYGGGTEMRLEQEILLGIGGYRALEALGLRANVYHMNEGHSAFLALEHMRTLMRRHGIALHQARELASASLVFTTHTPVEAGHDYFPPELIERYFSEYAREVGRDWRDVLALGQRNPGDGGEHFCMTILGMRLAAYRNGVSRLHGAVSRRMWQPLWPGVPLEEIPISHVTNGVHYRSWISYEMNQLFNRYLGPNWRAEPGEAELWRRVERIPAEELWRTHERRRERLVAFARRRLRQQLERRGAPFAEINAAEEVLDSQALTIGFARRFATYKRATLVLRDPERLARLLNDPERPVQLIFAGKAHPKDNPGKELIQKIAGLAREKQFRRRLVFLEDYDLAVARYLVQGCDVWLNTPKRPLEASGTSGMKATANGALNLSTLDGWWAEAWESQKEGEEPIGWAIGGGENYDSDEQQNQVEADALYELLERDVIPLFYEREADRLPRRWIGRMKKSLTSLCHTYNTHRMVKEYTERFYLPAFAQVEQLEADGAARARALGDWARRVREAWPKVAVEVVEHDGAESYRVGDRLRVVGRVWLAGLEPDDVMVELYVGRVGSNGEIVDALPAAMQPAGRDRDGWCLFEVVTDPRTESGLCGYTLRVSPWHADLSTAFSMGLIRWA